jgi:predicted transcriptional regulator
MGGKPASAGQRPLDAYRQLRYRHARRQWDHRGLNDGLAITAPGAQFLLSQSRSSSYHRRMTKLLEHAIEAVRRLSADSQDDIARTILHLVGSEVEAEPVDPAHLAAVLEGLAQAQRREFATDDEVEAAFRRFDR